MVTIDEASGTPQIRDFATEFQILVRRDYPIYLLMTGLYENLDVLQNDEILTFLYRAPKIYLRALNISSIAENYKSNFKLSDEAALDMAKNTKGYPFAFQVLGHFTFEHNGDYKAARNIYRQYLDEYVYDKIWMGLSKNDRKVLFAIAGSETGKIKEVRSIIGMKTNQFSPYRSRLVKRGLVDGDEYGYLRFALPFFREYAKANYAD